MVMLPSLATSSTLNGLNTVEDLTDWLENRYKCYMGAPKASMCLNEEELKKYDLSLDDLPIERKIWANDEWKQVNLIYSSVAFAVKGHDPEEAERQLVRALQEKFKEIPPQHLIWRVKPEFSRDEVVEYGETYATKEQIEDGLFNPLFMPNGVERDFDTDSYKYVKSKYILNKVRMRLVFPRQIDEDYEELACGTSAHPKRI